MSSRENEQKPQRKRSYKGDSRHDYIAVMGATATGKSDLALLLASRFNGEIISMDSRQVYRGMDIGTAKVPVDERASIPHHLIDILDPDESNSAGRHAELALQATSRIQEKGRMPILVGGTGLYFSAFFRGLIELKIDDRALREVRLSLSGKSTKNLYNTLRECDSRRAEALSPNDRMRITRALEVFMLTGKSISEHFQAQRHKEEEKAFKLVLTLPRMDLRARIAQRTQIMFRSGWVEEVVTLIAAGFDENSPGMNSLGYKEIVKALVSGRNPNDERENIITLTRQYAKRQETFFRREKNALWIDVSQKNFDREVIDLVCQYFHLKNNLT
jgi:tRNA dimethylallyltransferase